MKKFVLFCTLPILLFGCATTSTEQIGQTQLTPETPTSSIQPESEEATASPDIEEQKSLTTGKKEIKLAEPSAELRSKPAPVTPRRTWGGMFHVPTGLKPPTSDTRTEETTSTQTSSSGTPSTASPTTEGSVKKEEVAETTQQKTKDISTPELTDRAATTSTPNKRPWGGMWGAYIAPPSQTGSEEATSQNIETPPPASWDDYEEVDFGKFASGSYVSDYANKYIKVKCRFTSIGSEFVEFTEYQRPEYVTFIVTGVESQLSSLRVVMRKSQADTVFKLKPDKEIVLYGKAAQVDLYTPTIEVLKIEK